MCLIRRTRHIPTCNVGVAGDSALCSLFEIGLPRIYKFFSNSFDKEWGGSSAVEHKIAICVISWGPVFEPRPSLFSFWRFLFRVLGVVETRSV